jgi:molecular chaperone GrpE
MNLSASFQLLRSCTRASSSRALARPTLASLPSRRYYSDDKASESKPADKELAKDEKALCEEKLQAKESEVADLKVCSRVLRFSSHV